MYILGNGGHARSVSNLLLDLGIDIEGYISIFPNTPQISDIALIELNDLRKIKQPIECVIAIGNNFYRQKMFERLTAITDINFKFPILTHPKSYIAKNSILGEGTVVFPGAQLGSNTKTGKFTLLNSCSSLDHDSGMENFSSLAPGAVTGGEVLIGERSAILINAAISNKVKVGHDSVLGGGSTLLNSVGNLELWAGSPAKLIRKRTSDEQYF